MEKKCCLARCQESPRKSRNTLTHTHTYTLCTRACIQNIISFDCIRSHSIERREVDPTLLLLFYHRFGKLRQKMCEFARTTSLPPSIGSSIQCNLNENRSFLILKIIFFSWNDIVCHTLLFNLYFLISFLCDDFSWRENSSKHNSVWKKRLSFHCVFFL